MTSPLDVARRRMALLEAELKQLRMFIDMYEKFSTASETLKEQNMSVENACVSSETPSADESSRSNLTLGRRRRSGPTPRDIVAIAERMIREVGRPLSRGELLEMFEARDVDLPATDKARYIGTIMWRNKAKFINVEGRGYWLRGEPIFSPTTGIREAYSRLCANLDRLHYEMSRTGECPIPDQDYDALVSEQRRLKSMLSDEDN